MKLWEKNYLLTFVLFLFVLNSGSFLLAVSTSQNEFLRTRAAAVSEEQGIAAAISNIYTVEEAQRIVNRFCTQYVPQGTFLSVWDGGKLVVSLLPEDLRDWQQGEIRVVEIDDIKYIRIDQSIPLEGSQLELTYLKKIQHLKESQQKRLVVIFSVSLTLSLLVGIMLYVTMKNLYRPIANIAHELRTPLTGIQGYAQYLMLGKLTEEDRYFAAEQILKEAQNLKDIVERLLIMGNLRQGTVCRSKVSVRKLLDELRENDPRVLIGEQQIETVWGDEILLRCLLGNLVSNAVRAGSVATVSSVGRKITVHNDGSPIASEVLKRLNRSLPLSAEQIEGNGYGIALCREIVKLHRGSLTFRSSEKEGTTAVVELPEEIIL